MSTIQTQIPDFVVDLAQKIYIKAVTAKNFQRYNLHEAVETALEYAEEFYKSVATIEEERAPKAPKASQYVPYKGRLK